MSIKIIDTLTPANGSFPVVEDKHVKTGEKNLQEKLQEIDTGVEQNAEDINGLSQKLDSVDELSKETSEKAENLQNQIDNLVTGVPAEAEVLQARSSASGVNYQTLKTRLDSENSMLIDNINELYQYRGNMIDLGYVELSEAKENGLYIFYDSYEAPDVPPGVKRGWLFVHRSESGAVFQTLQSSDSYFARTINEQGTPTEWGKSTIYNNSFANNGFTACSEARIQGYYHIPGSYVSNVTDLPDGVSTACILVNYPWKPNTENVSRLQVLLVYNNDKHFIYYRWIVDGVASGWAVSDNYNDIVLINNKLESMSERLPSALRGDDYEFVLESNDSFWSVENSTVAVRKSLIGEYMTADPIDVANKDVITVTARSGTSGKQRMLIIVDENYKILKYNDNPAKDSTISVSLGVPIDAKYALITVKGTSDSQKKVKYTLANVEEDNCVGEKEFERLRKPLQGKRLSLLGDSISSYAGTIPSGNEAYYTGSNAGVSSSSQMWWSVLCENTGMTPLVINGWSGSAITQLTDSSHQNKIPMSDVSRSQALHSGDLKPDVIIIAGGVNDYSYPNSQAQCIVGWDGKSAPIKGNSFGETYACMIQDIQLAYPDAIVVCLSTWFTMRGVDNGYTLVNKAGYTQSDYDKEIENVAKIMHVPFIDAERCGFNRYNFYPNYAQDSEATPTHPNSSGQKIMGEFVSNQLEAIIKHFNKTDV